MPYRQTKRAAEARAMRCTAMRAAKARKRLEGPSVERQDRFDPPELRRLLIIVDFDRGRPIARTVALHRCDRIDCYDVRLRGRTWKPRMGWSRVLAAIRRGLPRMTRR